MIKMMGKKIFTNTLKIFVYTTDEAIFARPDGCGEVSNIILDQDDINVYL